ncbi:MAG: MoaD/ThiS family protein [Blastomonas sp.]
MVDILFFGKLRDIAGGGERRIALSEPARIETIIAIIAETDDLLGSMLADPSIKCALNGVLADRQAIVPDNAELAFLPPVSGG